MKNQADQLKDMQYEHIEEHLRKLILLIKKIRQIKQSKEKTEEREREREQILTPNSSSNLSSSTNNLNIDPNNPREWEQFINQMITELPQHLQAMGINPDRPEYQKAIEQSKETIALLRSGSANEKTQFLSLTQKTAPLFAKMLQGQSLNTEEQAYLLATNKQMVELLTKLKEKEQRRIGEEPRPSTNEYQLGSSNQNTKASAFNWHPVIIGIAVGTIFGLAIYFFTRNKSRANES